MVLPVASLVLLMVACSGLHFSAHAQVKTDASDSEQSITGQVNRRSKRAVTVLFGRLWKHVVSNAKLVKIDGVFKVFEKNGDYKEAYADFRSLTPTNVRKYPLGRDAMIGDLGDWKVWLYRKDPDLEGNGNPVLILKDGRRARREITYSPYNF